MADLEEDQYMDLAAAGGDAVSWSSAAGALRAAFFGANSSDNTASWKWQPGTH